MATQQREPGPIERIGTLEDSLRNLAQAYVQMQDRVQALDGLVEALTKVVGENVVQATQDLLMQEKIRKSVQVGLDAGRVAAAPVVGEKSILVGHSTMKGEVVRPGIFCVPFETMLPRLKEAFLGKGPGATYLVEETDETITVDEIYDPAAPLATSGLVQPVEESVMDVQAPAPADEATPPAPEAPPAVDVAAATAGSVTQ